MEWFGKEWVDWMGVLVLLICAILVAVLVLVSLDLSGRLGRGSCCGTRSRCPVMRTARDSASDEVLDAEVTVTLPVLLSATGASDDTGFQTILQSQLRTVKGENQLASTVSAVTDMVVISLLAETGGFTGATGTSSTSLDFARIDLRVLVDGVVADPGVIVFDDETRILSLSNQSLIAGAMPIALFDLFDLSGARAFTFLSSGITPGTHTVLVQARAQASALIENPLVAGAAAAVGQRTLLVIPSHDASIVQSASSSSSSSSSS